MIFYFNVTFLIVWGQQLLSLGSLHDELPCSLHPREEVPRPGQRHVQLLPSEGSFHASLSTRADSPLASCFAQDARKADGGANFLKYHRIEDGDFKVYADRATVKGLLFSLFILFLLLPSGFPSIINRTAVV